MRLLNIKHIELEYFADNVPRYAILSHTWEEEEVTFQDMEQGRAKDKKGYTKIKNCCSVARDKGYNYVWIDTCCIDKTSSAELTEAINSMYRYYRECEACYSFLSDISSASNFSQSRWFTRGWTLQELIAPMHMIFFNKEWQQLGTKASLGDKISERTDVPQAILLGTESFDSASVAQRMSWAAGRKTTRVEDRAYSLMGIFDINMPLLYGEGHKAFIRLQEEILRVSDDHSIFAWRHTDTRSGGGLLADSPDAFKGSKNIISWNPFTPYNSPFTVTNKGVHLDVRFIAQAEGGLGLMVLHCAEAGIKDRLIGVYLRDPFLTMEHFERCRTKELKLVDLGQLNPSQYPTRNLCIRLRGKVSSRTLGSHVSKDQGLQPRHSTQGDQNSTTDGAVNTANDEQEKDPRRRLSLAASEGNDAVVKELLALPNTNADSMNEEDRTPLSLAAEAGHEHIVDLLLNRREVDINSRDRHGLSPLSYAAALGHEKVVWILLARSDIIPGSQDVRKRTIVSIPARRGHKNLVRQLLARKDTQGHLIDGGGRSVLSHASETGQEEVARLILGSGKMHPDLRDQAGRSALWYASKNGHTGLVKLLLETGWVDPTSKDNDNSTSIWHAASNGYCPAVELLLAHHANFKIKGEHGRSPLCQASANGHTDVVKELLNHNADTEAKDKDGVTALWYAATRGYDSIVKMLLESGADPNVRGADRQTALWHACRKGYGTIAGLLLKNGADPDAVGDAWSKPALWHAASRGYHVIAQLLLESHARFLNQFGDIIGLDEAAKSGHQAVIKVYLENCPRGQGWDDNIRSALILAIHGKQAVIVEILIKSLENVREVLRATHAYWLLQPALLGDEATARVLLENGANVNESFDGTDTLRLATRHRCLAVTNLMVVANGFNPNALWCAVVEGDEGLVEVLLQHGADTEMKIKEGSFSNMMPKRGARYDNGWSLLFVEASTLAEKENCILELPLYNGIDVESKDMNGDTPLMHGASRLNTTGMLEVNVKNKDEVTPLMKAVSYNNIGVLRLP
ncbi:hypothetical protein BHE90_017367, partial [Fusarium euwallaceae]